MFWDFVSGSFAPKRVAHAVSTGSGLFFIVAIVATFAWKSVFALFNLSIEYGKNRGTSEIVSEHKALNLTVT